MPNRVVRDGILDSRAVGELTDEAELFYRKLMSIVDDFGRCEADLGMLRLKCFPRKLETWQIDKIASCIKEVSSILTDDGLPLVCHYQSGSKRYLQINNFNQRVRSEKSKFPGPEGSMTVIGRSDDGHLRASRAQGRSETKTKTKTKSETVDAFSRWIETYPNRSKIDTAARAWISLVDSGEIHAENLDEVFAGTERWKRSRQWSRDEGKFIPEPATFLLGNEKHSGRMWKDSPPSSEPDPKPPSSLGADPNAEWIQPPDWQSEEPSEEFKQQLAEMDEMLRRRHATGR